MAFHIYQRKKHQNLYFPSFYFFIVSVFFYFFLSFFKYFLHSLHFIYSFIYLVLYVSSFLSSSLPVFPSFFFFVILHLHLMTSLISSTNHSPHSQFRYWPFTLSSSRTMLFDEVPFLYSFLIYLKSKPHAGILIRWRMRDSFHHANPTNETGNNPHLACV